jgi:uncharacterized protein YbjQ (UPF0145 family)
MKICPKCQYARQASDSAPEYECPQCGVIYAKFDPNYVRPLTTSQLAWKQEFEAAELAGREKLAAVERERRITTMCVTTTHLVPCREIDCVIDIISAQCVSGINIIKDNIIAVSDVLGGRSGTLQNTFDAARKTSLRELREQAFAVGADAVVGVDVVYNQFSGIGKSMVFVVSTGTAVKLK